MMKTIVVDLLTAIVMLSPPWGGTWLVARGRRRKTVQPLLYAKGEVVRLKNVLAAETTRLGKQFAA